MSAVFPISEREIEVLDRAGHGLQPTQIQWDGRVEEESPNTIARHLNLYHKSMEGQTLPCQITGKEIQSLLRTHELSVTQE